jgi:hypothetical protein
MQCCRGGGYNHSSNFSFCIQHSGSVVGTFGQALLKYPGLCSVCAWNCGMADLKRCSSACWHPCAHLVRSTAVVAGLLGGWVGHFH